MNAQNTTSHTPTPWRTNGATITAYGAWGLTIASCRSRQDPVNAHPGLAAKTTAEAGANAAFIVRACNAHDELLEALRRAELSTVQIRMAADIGDKTLKAKIAWYERQLEQLQNELRAVLAKL